MKRIIKNDNVIVISGSCKGQIGKILSVIENRWVIVEGVNKKKKHLKGNPHLNIESRIAEIEAKIHISNVALIDPTTNLPGKIGYKFEDVGSKKTKVRYFKKTNTTVQV